MSDKYHHLVADSTVPTNPQAIDDAVAKILGESPANPTRDQLLTLLSCVDLTSLNATDSPRSIAEFVERVNRFEEDHGDLPDVAAVCLYPNFAQVARTVLEVSDVKIACVAGGFPSAQTFPEVKVAEVALAVEGGADEIDVVMNLGNFVDGDWEEVCDELTEMRHSARDSRLKVIIESGALANPAQIAAASILALNSGADFIKTSTGKGYPGASHQAAYVMASAIKEYHLQTGRKVGFKAAGGITTPAEAFAYYRIVESVLGSEWLTPEYFRIGASRLANNLLSAITGNDENFF